MPVTRRSALRQIGVSLGASLALSTGVRATAPPTLSAFDIDGALTRAAVREEYHERRADDHIVGIVTARDYTDAEAFIEKHDLAPDFLRAQLVKVPALNSLETTFATADPYIYIGSWLRDWVAAIVAGWRYLDAGDIK